MPIRPTSTASKVACVVDGAATAPVVADRDNESSRSVCDYWRRAVLAFAERPFVTLGVGGRTFTYQEIDHLVNGASRELIDAGFGRGSDMLFTVLPNSLEAFLVNLAAAKLNAVLVPAPASSTRSELDYLLEHSETEFIAIRREDAARHGFSVEEDGSEFVGLSRRGGGWRSRPLFADLESSHEAPVRDRCDGALRDVHGIYYTSGTTGRPKGVLFPHAGFVSAGPGMASALGLTASDNVLLAMPLFHVGGAVMIVSAAMAVGAQVTLMPRFSASEFWTVVRAARVTTGLLMPSMLAILKRAAPTSRDADNPLEMVWSHTVDEDFCRRFGTTMQVCWGQTETSTMGTVSGPDRVRGDKGFAGYAYPGDAAVAVRDDQGNIRSTGPGELMYKHSAVMRGYYKDPVNTAETLQDGWVRTGDFGEVDQTGAVFFKGRLRHVIKRHGENISGEEVEEAIANLDWIVEVAAFAVPDEIRGEEVLVCVRLDPGVVVDAQSIARALAGTLAAWKIPRYSQVFEQPFPRLANGKINRLELRELLGIGTAFDRERPDRGRAEGGTS